MSDLTAFEKQAAPDGTFRIAIVGGGPVGLAAAAALQTVPGVVVRVLRKDVAIDEHDPRLIELWPNARHALHHVGLAADLEKVAEQIERYDFRSLHGQLLWAMPIGALGRKLRLATIGVTLKQLTTSLAKSAEGLVFKESVTIKAVRATAGGLVISREVGDDLFAELVLAADGADTVLRKPESALLPPATPRRRELVAIGGRAMIKSSLAAPGTGFVFHGDGIRFSGWPCPEDKDYVRWLAFVEPGVAVWGDKGAPPPDGKATRAALLERLHRLHLPARNIVEKTKAEHLRAWRLADAPPGQTWTVGRVAALGDAAHAMLPDLGQACAMAFEDLVVLKRLLTPVAMPGATTEALAEALGAWQKQRRARVQEVTAMSRAASYAAHGDASLDPLRDFAIAAVAPPFLMADLERLVSYDCA